MLCPIIAVEALFLLGMRSGMNLKINCHLQKISCCRKFREERQVQIDFRGIRYEIEEPYY